MILNNNNSERIIIKTKSRPVIDTHEIEADPKEIFREICEAIREGGYNPTSQIVGYIISEDPTHITNYNNARTMMSKIDRDDLLENMVKQYIEHIEKTADANEANKENG